MNRLDALLHCLEKEPQVSSFIQPKELIKALLVRDGPLFKKLGMSERRSTALTKAMFPDKPKSGRICEYLFSKNDIKYCAKCNLVLSLYLFNKNKAKPDGLGTQCAKCSYLYSKPLQNALQAGYRASKRNRTPKWSETEEIAKFYSLCPKGYHVDHIIPLNGETVSGLHVLGNLQYLDAIENIKKSNKYEGL